ncbi:uncharacterized protein LOC111025738 [Momordica charantia]|uniref:Uncharacterized protein LOC111025738 n=1 Tax=Momordica charantia TaxID=3673 RepID=A0A6J1DZJ1_MOMCH|nr:uncharacterized protein LOC111025738 [Momordica charantia]
MVQPVDSTNTGDRRALVANDGHQREVGAEVVEGQIHEGLGTEPFCRSARITTPDLSPAHPKPFKANRGRGGASRRTTLGAAPAPSRENFDALQKEMEAMRTQMLTMEEMYNEMVQAVGAGSRSEDRAARDERGDLRDHLSRKRSSSLRKGRSPSCSHKNSNQQAESSYNPVVPEGVITREEFDQLKSKFDAQVETLKARCEVKGSTFDDGDLGESPFTSDILEALIPSKFKTPTMKPYDGSKDPKDYVEVFEGLMGFQAATDAIKYRAFQIALTSSARLWYRRLPARSISTYSQLRKEFNSQFSSRHYERKTATHLATIRQKERETLREYVTWFQEEQLKVAHYSDDSALCYFLTDLVDETLTVKLGEEAPATFAEVLQKAKKVIDGQELFRTKTGRSEKQIDQKKPSQEKRKAESKSKDKAEYRRSDSGPSRSRPY